MNTKPGYCDESLFFQDERMFRKYLNFILPLRLRVKESKCWERIWGKFADIGPKNGKIEYIKQSVGIQVDQIETKDFNFDPFGDENFKKYDTVFCFEIIEHLQNPLFFIAQIKHLLKDGGVLYLSTPARPKWLWT